MEPAQSQYRRHPDAQYLVLGEAVPNSGFRISQPKHGLPRFFALASFRRDR
jgi:hypothetical protein